MSSILLSRGISILLYLAAVPTVIGIPTKAADPPAASATPPVAGPAKTPATDAEKIANARDSIKQATLALEKLQKRLVDPQGEYRKAEAEFEALNGKLKAAKMTAAKLRREGKEAEAVATEATLPGLQEDWQLAKDRFDIAIRQKKATEETIAGLKERIESDKQLLERLDEDPQPDPKATTPAAPTTPAPVPAAPPRPTQPAATPAASAEPIPAADPHGPAPAVPGLPGFPPPATSPAAGSPGTTTSPPPGAGESDPVVRRAREQLDARRVESRDAEARVRLAEERVRVMERAIQNAQKLLELEQESVGQAEKAAAKFSTALHAQPPANPAERDALGRKLMETEQRLAESRARAQRITDRIAAFDDSLAGLKAELGIVAKEAEQKRTRVSEAEAELNALLSPTAPRNLFRWVITKGPRLVMILLGIGLVHLVARQFSRQIVGFITRNGQRGSPEDRENRANTLVGVFRYAAGVVVFGGGLVMLLDEVGVPVVPLMGGAAVIGLAVAFGAQNLIRDYFTGFMMLMEDQYSVNDVVRIGSIAGLVELITLRMTVLRDLEGVRHFIPHGTVTSVSNLTHGWSRAMIDVPVAYKENVDRVIGVLMQLGREMRLDPALGHHILEDPEMLGVDSLGDSGVVIRFLLKTRPLQQWPVKREMLRRIKNRFDELGIEIPFPHQTVYHRYPDGAGGVVTLGGAGRDAA